MLGHIPQILISLSYPKKNHHFIVWYTKLHYIWLMRVHPRIFQISSFNQLIYVIDNLWSKMNIPTIRTIFSQLKTPTHIWVIKKLVPYSTRFFYIIWNFMFIAPYQPCNPFSLIPLQLSALVVTCIDTKLMSDKSISLI